MALLSLNIGTSVTLHIHMTVDLTIVHYKHHVQLLGILTSVTVEST